MTLHGFPVVLLNGPPRCGKDTAGAAIASAFPGAVSLKFSAALKRCTHELFGLDGAEHDAYEAVKDTPLSEFGGLTPRQAYIRVSEDMTKPAFGTVHFGRVMATRLARARAAGASLAAVTDCGFAHEVAPVIEAIGRRHALLVRLHRPGHTFAGDSRGRVEGLGVAEVDLCNEGDAGTLAREVVGLVRDWLWSLENAE